MSECQPVEASRLRSPRKYSARLSELILRIRPHHQLGQATREEGGKDGLGDVVAFWARLDGEVGMDVQARAGRLAGQRAELGREDLLVFAVEVLAPEERHPALRHCHTLIIS